MFMHVVWLGRVGYPDALALQQRVVAARKAGTIADTLLLLEHPPVLTLGRNAIRANILASDVLLAARGVEVHETNRGGDVTYHGPGQLIGWPVLDLRGDLPGKKGPASGSGRLCAPPRRGAHYGVCGEFGVMSERIKGRTGVWTLAQPGFAEKKLAAIGVHVSQAVISHGFALNVSTDLRDFAWIVPCGIADRAVTSLELESPQDPAPGMEAARNATIRQFGRVFGRQMLCADSLTEILTPSQPVL